MNFCQEFSIWGRYFYILENILLGWGAPYGCVGAFYWKEGGIQVLAGLAPSSQKLGSLM
jgi:hypothetical protein